MPKKGNNQKIWSPQQDQILKQLLNQYSIPYPWKQIAKIMKTKHNILGKNFKDCRERWQNYVPQVYGYSKWSYKQELLLLEKHELLGNKWFELCHFFPGRKETFIKNQFYSIFRKGLKKANAQLYFYKNNKIRPITKALVLKALVICQSKFNKKKLEYCQALKKAAEELKRILIYYLYSTLTPEQGSVLMQSFLNTINQFRKQLKVKPEDPNITQTLKTKEQRENIRLQLPKLVDQQQIPDQSQEQHSQLGDSSQQEQPKQIDYQIKTVTNPSSTLNPRTTVTKIEHIQNNPRQQQVEIPEAPLFTPMLNNYYPMYPPTMPMPMIDPILSYQNYLRSMYSVEHPYLFNSRPYMNWNGMFNQYY